MSGRSLTLGATLVVAVGLALALHFGHYCFSTLYVGFSALEFLDLPLESLARTLKRKTTTTPELET